LIGHSKRWDGDIAVLEEILVRGMVLSMRYLSPMSRMVRGAVNWCSESQLVNVVVGWYNHVMEARTIECR